MRTNLLSLSLLAAGIAPVCGQDAGWKPVSNHRAGYQEASGLPILLGKPVRKVDRSVEPAQFAGQVSVGAALPPAPPGPPTEYEVLPFPKAAQNRAGTAGASQAGTAQNPPAPALPGAPTAGRAGMVPSYPSGLPAGVVIGPETGGAVMQGPVFEGGVDPGCCGIAGVSGVRGDRYFLTAPHGAPARWYGTFDYLLWSISNDKAPPLVTTGPETAPDPFNPGAINSPGVRVLYGGGEVGDATLNGARVSLGVWFNRCQTWGMMGSFFTTQERADHFVAASDPDGSPALFRPFFNTDTGLQDSELVSTPGSLAGSVRVDHTTRLTGADLNFRFNLVNNSSCSGRTFWHTDAYAGVRWLQLSEGLNVTENLRLLVDDTTGEPTLPAGTTFVVNDRFGTHNDFVGANLGLMTEYRWKRFFVGLRGGVGIGATRQNVNISGDTTITFPADNVPEGVANPSRASGGLLALEGANIGKYSRSVFSVVPEFGLNLGMNVTDSLRVYVGYDLMYWTHVARPGRQIDFSVNRTRLPFSGAPSDDPHPVFQFRDSNVLVHGLTAGLQWVY